MCRRNWSPSTVLGNRRLDVGRSSSETLKPRHGLAFPEQAAIAIVRSARIATIYTLTVVVERIA